MEQISARSVLCAVLACLLSPIAFTPQANAQADGDQIVDGIGETALIARYPLNGNAEDRSRNSHNAKIEGSGATFVDDAQFGRVLSLPGEPAAHLVLPGDALNGFDSLSVVGWVFLRGESPWQRFFDFGQSTEVNFFCTPVGDSEEEGYRARITTSGWMEEQGPVSERVPTNRWVHLAVVLDSSRKTLSTYLDGRRVGHATDLTLNLESVINQNNASANQLFIGKSRYETDAALNAKLHDVRLYSIALSGEQVSTIRNNALSGQRSTASSRTSTSAGAATSSEGVLAQAAAIARVPDISVETEVGYLPKLPPTIPAVYRDSAAGSKVRVIWPSPTNNQQVLQPGTYTVTGKVPGTDFQPKATISVVEKSEATKAREGAAAERELEPFPLGSVVLNPDDHGHDTQFIKNREKFIRTLAETDPDRFLYNFRDAFGQKQPEGAEPLRGWDSQTTRLRGHASGHYLTAIAQAYASTTYDPELQAKFLGKMNYLIDTLHDLAQKSGKPATPGGEFVSDPTKVPPGPGKSGYDSDLSTNGIRTDYWNWGEGFISGYPPDQFIMLEQGATYGTRNNQIWAPYYTLHKILAGLLDCYEVGGNRKALAVAEGMGRWVYARLRVIPTETRISMWNRYIAGEYGGMNEVMARLYRITNDRQFLEGAKLFDNISFFFGDAQHSHGLAKNVDTIRGKHANQHIPQITGALETYRGSHDPAYYNVANNFWDLCTQGYMYSIGGVAGARNPNNAECFTAQPNTLFENGFARGGQNETCATYNLLKLSRQLFMFDQNTKYMDYYERALYNHILASVAENNAGNTYHVPLNPGSRKQFGNANMSGFTCCNGTAIESSTKLQDSIYFRAANNDALYVNLFVPSTLTWKDRNIVVKQQTAFPYAETTRLTISSSGGVSTRSAAIQSPRQAEQSGVNRNANQSGPFTVHVRVPKWASKGYFVRINGQEQSVTAEPGTYLALKRAWKDGDTIEVRVPFDFRLEPVMDQPNIASIFYGPVLLAAEEPENRVDWRKIELNGSDLSKSFEGDPAKLRFTVGEVKFKPFFETYDRHSVYFDVSLK